ncbi:MAG: substrate-binding domain-containing protein [Oscillospiraceae bacterium]|nr:substrate-binding domain-containing protein [Oscillospiraceae bacterium]
MKKLHLKLALLLCICLLLSGCAFPLQRVSPDPVAIPTATEEPAAPTFRPGDFAIPAPPADAGGALAEPAETPVTVPALRPIAEPKLALFWYAMADARVFELREAFAPVLADSGMVYREYDAENDRYRQLDQIRDAVSGGWDILAVQLVAESDSSAAEEILQAAGGNPVLFFDRVPDPDRLPADAASGSVALIGSDPAEAGRLQGKMAGDYLVQHFSTADLNQDGQIRYTYLLSSADSAMALLRCSTAVEAANAVLIENGYRPLAYCDEETTICYQADPTGAGSSDAGTDILRNDLSYYNYTNSNMIELILADTDDMALGALTALQASWCNLGDGSTVTIPLFGIGGAVAARSAVSLGQMTGTVGVNAGGYADAVLSAAQGLASGQTAEAAITAVAVSSADYVQDNSRPWALFIAPSPVHSDHG